MTDALASLRPAFARVFANPAYLALAGVLAMLAFLLAVWFPNLALIAEVFSGRDVQLAAKLGFALSLLGGIATNFNLFSAGYTIAITVLFGVSTAMIAWLLRQKRVVAAGQNLAIGSGAVASGVVGIGCAACGSLILGTVLPSLGAAGAIAALPLKGEEFGILSVALLFVSLLLVSKGVVASGSCALDRTTSVQHRSST